MTKDEKQKAVATISTRRRLKDQPQLVIQNVGRFCKDGCGEKIPEGSRKDREFFSPNCRRRYSFMVFGHTSSRFAIKAILKLKKKSNSRKLVLYPKKGQAITVKVTKESGELWEICNRLEREEKKLPRKTSERLKVLSMVK